MLNFKPRKILYRIILPFTVLFAITTALSWLFSAYLISRHLDRSLKNQMEQVAGLISRSGYVLNPAILSQLKGIITADIVFSDKDGRIISTTFQEDRSHTNIQAFLDNALNLNNSGKDVLIGAVGYRTLIHPVILPDRGPGFLSLWIPVQEAERLKKRIILGTGGMALIGILAMAAIGYWIARSITAPVEELVTMTGRVASGDFSQRAQLGSRDEINTLADSFNLMIDRLKAFEKKQVETEKLATAGRMAAGLAHEIRNPLTSIRMLGQVLHNRLKDRPESRKALLSMIKEIDRLDRIIQEMIHRTRPGELQYRWGDLNESVEEVMGVAGENLSAQGISFEKDLTKPLPEIYYDHEKIKQVLWNLVNNAREAMPKGGMLSVSTRKTDDGCVEILVDDTGPGIPPEESEMLFQPFFTTKPEGVGLGLTMSRKIVEKHGGRLLLESRTDGGMRARVVIPTQESKAK